MFYIRFLSVPKVASSQGSRRALKFVIAVSTDLGDAFLTEAAGLRAAVVDDEKEKSLATSSVTWPSGARALPIELRFECHGHVPPLRVRLAPADDDVNGFAATRLGHGALPRIVGVMSSPLRWADGVADARVERRFALSPDSAVPPLVQWEDAGDSIARHIWDGGLALVACLADLLRATDPPAKGTSTFGASLLPILRRAPSVGLRAMELGAGCGTVGTALVQLAPGVRMLLTDLPDATPLLAANIRAARLAGGSSLDAAVLDWDGAAGGAELLRQRYDLVVVSECTYNSDSIPVLVRCLAALSAAGEERPPLVLLSTKVRHDSESVFFDLMAAAGLREIDRTAVDLPPAPGVWRPSDQVDIYLFQKAAVSGDEDSHA